MHLHGSSDWVVADRNGILAPVNYGKTTRMGFTNTTTGLLETDGTVLRMSDNQFSITNQESNGNLNISTNGILSISVPNVGMTFSNASKRIFVGVLNNQTSPTYANFNLAPGNLENGLYIHNTGAGTYGVSVRTAVNTNDAIRVMGINGSLDEKNFAVKGNGEVFARKYTTTLAPIPDYVFDLSYKLLPLNELKSYISINKHLPNIPSAKDYETRGEIDLGELNLLLLEKVEELTLYILQLEERTKALENK